MISIVDLGSAPESIEPIAINRNTFLDEARVNAETYIRLLERVIPIIDKFTPYMAYKTIICPEEDRYKIQLWYDSRHKDVCEHAHWIECNIPLNWDKEALKELKELKKD